MTGSLVLIWPVVTAAFLASLVEAVEALTIVLAVATVRGWRPAGWVRSRASGRSRSSSGRSGLCSIGCRCTCCSS
jgi:hypothetical protein